MCQWKWSLVFASCSATQSWMLSLASASCFVTKQSCSIHYYEFPTSCPNSHLVVRLYQPSSLCTVAIYCTLSHRENTSFEVWCLHSSRQWTRGTENWVSAFCKFCHHQFCESVPFSLWFAITSRIPLCFRSRSEE